MAPPKRKTAGELEAEAKAAMIARIRESLVGWYPGKWAEELGYGPTCSCNLRGWKGPCACHGDATGTDTVAAG